MIPPENTASALLLLSRNCSKDGLVESGEQGEDFQRLHHLVGHTRDIKDFLNGMTRLAATTLSRSTGASIGCAVTLHRRKRRVTIAGSSDATILLDGVEQSLGDGPCLEALATLEPVLLADTATDERWPGYSRNLAAAGARSVLGVPLDLGTDASAALNFFAQETGLFTDEVIEDAAVFADMAGQALQVAMRIAAADLLAEDLKAAMEHRHAIDLATGMIMGESECSQDEAFAMLLKASQNRNQKLHEVARSILTARGGDGQRTENHFDD